MDNNTIDSKKNIYDWILRFAKGMIIGLGAILPGVSGGALAAIFGLYEKMISFIANITKDFKKNFIFFLPVGIGGVFGVFLLSFAVSYFLENAQAQVLWFFIGCIVGMLPSLFKEAKKHGRETKHIIIMVVTFIASLFLLRSLQNTVDVNIQMNFFTWIVAGAIVGLGLIVPGLSSSNFLVYFNMYKAMTDGIKDLDFSVIVPLGIGVILIILSLSKVINFIFKKAYAILFHFILGIVLSSTVMIIPFEFNYLSLGGVVCIVTALVGILLGFWMSKLEDKYQS